MASNRIIYESTPCYGKMTQGSIINGCIAEDFPNEEVYGLIITPRCAMDHVGKVSTVHYVPVVPFERWFDVIAKPIIKKQWKKELADKINAAYSKAKIGNEIMSANLLYEDLNRINQEKTANSKTREEISSLLDSYFDKKPDAFIDYLQERVEIQTTNKKKRINYLSELIKNNHAEFYLIECWKEYGKGKHLVVILRDVRRIQFEVAEKIKGGITESELNIENTLHNDLFLNRDESFFFWVQAQIASPFIEHIMQAFVYNFSRIGVEDRSDNTLDLLNEAINSSII